MTETDIIDTLRDEALINWDVNRFPCNPNRTMSCLGKRRDGVIKTGGKGIR